MNRLATALLSAALVVGVLPVMGQPAEAATPEPIGFGMEAGAIDLQTNAGVKPDYGTFWIGPWTLKYGWGGTDDKLDSMRSKGVTPAIHFYYWGDDISQNCLENGCYSDLHNAQKNKAGWQTLAQQMVDHLDARMGGEEVVIFLESEFNKADVQTYEPLDGYLAEKAAFIHKQYPNAKVVMSLGSWNSGAWATWDRTAAASDYVGIQGMRGSTRDSPSHYRDLYETTLTNAKKLQGLFGKPVFLQDIALSSYPEPDYLSMQSAELKEFFDGMGELKSAGVVAMVYRSWRDSPNMDLANYYREAERHWGLTWNGYDLKPAGKVWIDGVKAERTGAAAPAPSGPAPAFTASFAPSKNVNEWWVDVKVTASNAPIAVAASHDGGTFVALSKTSWGTWAKSFHAPAGGTMVYRATDAYGQSVTSDPFPWLTSEPTPAPAPEPANRAPAAAFTKATSGLTVSFDASGSSDPDGDALTYAWDFGDGAKATGVKASHTYTPAGTYTVKLTVSDGSLSATAAKDVSPAPLPAFAASFDVSPNVNPWWVEVRVAGSAAPAKVEASHDGGAYVALSKTSWGSWAKSFSAPAGGTMVYRATDAHGQTVASQPMKWLDQPPQAALTTATSGLTVSFDASGSSDPDGDALTYAWDFGDGAKATGVKASHTYTAAGTFTVKLTASDGTLAAAATRTVTVAEPNRAPGAAFTVSASELTVSFDASGSSDPDGDALTYAWDFGDGAKATGVKASHTYTSAGTYTVQLTVSDGALAAAATESVTVVAPPPIPVPTYGPTFAVSPNVNEWWVEVRVAPDPKEVDARVDGGAWIGLEKRSWGSWAKSFRVPAGSLVEFRATDAAGQTAVSQGVPWLKPALSPSPSPAPAPTSFDAVFSPKTQENRWWIETDVKANEPIRKVEFRVDGGAWKDLPKTSWGSYAVKEHVKQDAQVQFRATSTGGATDLSGVYLWG